MPRSHGADSEGYEYYDVHGEEFIIRIVDANEIIEMSVAIDGYGDVASVNGIRADLCHSESWPRLRAHEVL